MTFLFTVKELCPKPCTLYSLYNRVPFSSMLPKHELYEHPLETLLHKDWNRSAPLTLDFFCSCFEDSVSFYRSWLFLVEKYVPSKAVVFPNLFGRWESLALARVQPQNRGRGAKTVSSNGQFWSPSNPQMLKFSYSAKYSLNIQMLRSCKEARVFRCSDVQMLKCLDARMLWSCSN